MISQTGRGSSTIVTSQVLLLTQPVAVLVMTSEYVPAPTVMQRVVAPVFHRYVYSPAGPQICTVSPGQTRVSGASIVQFGRGSSVIVTAQLLLLTQPVTVLVMTSEYVPAPTVRQRVVAPVFHRYV